MKKLPARVDAGRGGALAEFDFSGLPEAAVDVICQLLAASGDPALARLAEEMARARPFSLDGTDPLATGDALVAALPEHVFCYAKREIPNPAEYAQLDPFSVGAWFEPGGVFQSAMPEYEYRREQHDMAAAVADAFGSQRHLVVEAGTGIGKTMAYLVPSVLWSLANKVPVIISTNTKNLQEQIFRKDLPVIARIMSRPFKSAVIKGRANYVCLSKVANLLDHREAELVQEQFVPMARVCAWLFRTASGDLSEIEYAGAIGDKLASSAEECPGRKCRFHSRCHLQWARNCSLNADVVLTNHSVYFSEPDDKPLALPKHAQVVFDEAHNLEEAATRKFLREVTGYSFRNALRKIHLVTRKKESGYVTKLKKALLENNFLADAASRDAMFEILDSVAKGVDSVRNSSRRFLRAVAGIPRQDEGVMRMRPQFVESPVWIGVVPLLNDVLDGLCALSDEMERIVNVFIGGAEGGVPEPPEQVAEFWREAAAHFETLKSLESDLDFISSVKDRNWVYWITSSRSRDTDRVEGGLHAAPVEIAQYMADTLFAKKETVVLCSATMNVGGSPQFIAHRIGLDLVEPERVRSVCIGSPFDYKRQCFAGVPMFLPDVAGAHASAEAEYTAAFAGLAAKLAVVTRGRMLVLFTSYRMMVDCGARMESALSPEGIRVLRQGAGLSRETITAMFREDRPSVLLGTDSFWEGVDLMGEVLSCLVIARLPFDAVNDPIVSARSERVAENGGDSFREFALPNAIIKFRQGFGRLIRHNEDRGVVVIADQRICTKNYGSTFRRELPTGLVKFAGADELLKSAGAFLGNRQLEP